jgi:two-component system, chemotaxis family, sensor kinase CheA
VLSVNEMNEIRNLAIQEASDLIDEMEDLMLDLEKEGQDNGLYDELLRLAHTFKGSTGTAGFGELAELAHKLEDVVQIGRKKTEVDFPKFLDIIDRALEGLSSGINSLAAGGVPSSETEGALRELAVWLENNNGAVGLKKSSDCASDQEFILGEYDLIRMKVLRKQNKKFFRITVPVPRSTSDAEQFGLNLLKTFRANGIVLAVSPPEAELHRLAETGIIKTIVAVETSKTKLRNLLRAAGVRAAKIDNYEPTTEVAEEKNISGALNETVKAEDTVRIGMNDLDDLLRLVGELMIARGRFEKIAPDLEQLDNDRHAASTLDNLAEKFEQLAINLQAGIIGSRMVSASRLFRAAKRHAKKAGRRVGKTVRVVVSGENAELDVKLIDELENILGNMIDYVAGSTPAESNNLNEKDLLLSAERKGNNLVLVLRVENIAVSDEFLSEIRSMLSLLNGSLELLGSNGLAEFRISLPMTLAIIPTILVEVGDDIYAFPIEAIEETVQVNSAEILIVGGCPVIDLRGEPLPLIFIRQALNKGEGENSVQDSFVLVVRNGDRLVGLVADRILGRKDVVKKPIGSMLSGQRELSGAAIMADGRIALILNVYELLQKSLDRAA